LRIILARIAQSLGLILAVIVLNFTLINLAPGDPATQGDLGDSFFFNRSVVSLILDRLWPTILLVGTALLMAIFFGVLVGVFTARRPESPVSHFATVMALVGFSMPVFWTGLLLIILFASVVQWLPIGGMRDVQFDGGLIASWVDVAKHLVLPAFTLGFLYIAQYSRLARASMLEVLQSDFVRTARAKGLAERVVVCSLISGALVVETVFNWPGLGRLAFDAVLRRDAPVLLGVLLVSAVVVIVANLLTDIVYRLIDPRIRVGS